MSSVGGFKTRPRGRPPKGINGEQKVWNGWTGEYEENPVTRALVRVGGGRRNISATKGPTTVTQRWLNPTPLPTVTKNKLRKKPVTLGVSHPDEAVSLAPLDVEQSLVVYKRPRGRARHGLDGKKMVWNTATGEWCAALIEVTGSVVEAKQSQGVAQEVVDVDGDEEFDTKSFATEGELAAILKNTPDECEFFLKGVDDILQKEHQKEYPESNDKFPELSTVTKCGTVLQGEGGENLHLFKYGWADDLFDPDYNLWGEQSIASTIVAHLTQNRVMKPWVLVSSDDDERFIINGATEAGSSP